MSERKLVQLGLVPAVILGLLAVLPPASSVAAEPTHGSPSSCLKPFDSYTSTAALRSQCKVVGYPRLGTSITPDGIAEYAYNIEGLPTVYQVPTQSFRAETASASTLAALGIPQRPTDAAQVARWKATVVNILFQTPPPVVYAVPLIRAAASSIWSGYLETGHTYNSSNSTYYEPGLFSGNCNSSSTSVVFWSGLGGWNSGNLAQDGTAENTPGLGQNQAWSEVLPQQNYVVAQNLYATTGGDFEADVSYNGGNNFSFFMRNDSTNNAISYRVTANGYDGSTAEQVAERPTVGGRFTNLSNFHNILFNFNSVSWVGSGGQVIGNAPNQSITMYNGSNQLTSESGLSSGQSFTVNQLRCN